MRTLEIMLLLADLMALLSLSNLRLRGGIWIRHWPVIAVVMGAGQWFAEGPRWQMLPAYALTVTFFLVWLHREVASRCKATAKKRRHPMVATAANVLGGSAIAAAVALPLMVPVFAFPPPKGPYAIGTLTFHWIDTARPEVFVGDPTSRRQLMAQFWYPARANLPDPPAAYIPDADVVTAAFARIHDKPAFVFGHFKYITSNAKTSAPSAADHARYPVLIFLEGATGFRQMNTFQIEHLVSHGYIVVAIDQPGAAATVVFPDGQELSGLTVAEFQAAVSPSYVLGQTNPMPMTTLLPNGSTLKNDDSIIPYLAQDVVFALDQLDALNQKNPSSILSGKLDLQRVGAFGVSLGGIVVGESCRIDARLRACLVMDAPMPASVVKAGLHQPSMWITRDATSMRLERQRIGGWPDAEIDAHQNSMRAVFDGLSGAGYFVQLLGVFHSNFTDVASWTPLFRLFGLSGPIDEDLAHDIVNDYSLAFFDRHLLDQPSKLLDGNASNEYPEVVFESRRP